jgi:hypothetical protein
MPVKKFATRRKLAFLIAPMWAPLAMAIYVSMGRMPTPGSWVDVAVLYSAAFSYGAMLFVGFPAYKFMISREWTSFPHAAFAGILIGFGASYLGHITLNLFRGPGFIGLSAFYLGLDWPFVAIFAVIGALVSCTVWWIDRPDRRTSS